MKSFVCVLVACVALAVCAQSSEAAVRRTVVRGPLGLRRTVVREVVAPQAVLAPQAVIVRQRAVIAQPQAIIVPQQSYGQQSLILVR